MLSSAHLLNNYSQNSINPKNAFINVGLSLENRQETRKLGLLPPGKSFEAVCERLELQERKERVFKGQPDIDDFNYICWVNTRMSRSFRDGARTTLS
jgi:hypothetical protein